MKKLRGLAIFLLLVFTVNFIPVQAYVENSKFGISNVWSEILENGDREIYLGFDGTNSKNIKEVKLYTKVVSVNYSLENNKYDEIVVDGPSILLNKEDISIYKGYLNESQIKDFGDYQVDRIEIFLEDGSKQVSYNTKYYTSISDNNKENGELINYFDSILYVSIPLNLKYEKLEFNTVKLGQDQNYMFEIESRVPGVEAQKVYVEFVKLNDESNRKQVVIAEKSEDGKYSSKLNLKNSLDTGIWKVGSLTVVDNYGRQYNLGYNYGKEFKVVSTNTDIDAPKLNSIELSSNVYDASEGKPITFTIDVTDDISGFNHGYINIKNGFFSKSIYLGEYNKIDDKYKIEFNDFDENGIWEIENINLIDKAGNEVSYIQNLPEYTNNNSKYIQMDFSDKKIEVRNIKKDEEEKPEINIELLDMNNNKPEIINGEEINLTIKLKANVELNDTIYMNYKAKESNKHLYLNGYLDYQYDENGNSIKNEDGVYTYNVRGKEESLKYLATNNYECIYFSVGYSIKHGTYYSKMFLNNTIEGNMGNYNDVELDLSQLNINCNNPNEDITPPEIVEISTDKSIIIPGESVELKIKVKDDKSGIDYWAIGIRYDLLDYIESPIYDKESSTYIAKVTIPEYFTTGKYNISYINLRDIAGNNINYTWDNEENRELLSKGTILVKSDLNEKLPPEITTNIKANGQVFKAPFTPIVSTDHGSLSMLLDGEKYSGEAINKVGNHQLYIEATGVDGSVTTKLVSFKVIAEINNETKPEDIVDQITSSTDKEVVVEVSSDNKEIDKTIFEAIKGEDKTVSFKQEDGTVWSFNGKDIKDENLEGIENIKISVSNEPEEENKDSIENLDTGARVIHFDYHGVLPGKATVKIKVDNPQDLMGKELTFYYFNPETQKAEKVQGPLSIDIDGYVTVEIEHCSDYFLSADDSLHLDEPIITVEKEVIELVEGETKAINATVKPVNTKLEYISSDENVVTVDENGLLTAKSEGEAKITIKALEVSKEITVKVKKKNDDEKPGDKPQDPVEPTVPGEEVKPQNPVEPTVPGEEVKPQDPVEPTVPGEEVKPQDPVEPTVPGEEVKPQDPVEPTVPGEEVKPQDPVEPTVPGEEVKPQVPIVPSVPEEEVKPETPVKPIVIIERNQIDLTLGEAFNINAKVTPEDKTIEYISSNTNIIEVNKFGLITTKMPGEAIIVVKCEDVTREIKVTVKKNEEVTIEGDNIDTNTDTNNDVVEDNNSNNKNEENQNNLPTTGQVVSSLQLGLAALMVIGVGVILFRRRKNIN